MRKTVLLSGILSFLFILSGCGGGSSMPTETPPGDPAMDNPTEADYAVPEATKAN